MREIDVKFTEVEARNLLVFLSTVELVGKDVPAFVDVLNKVTDALEGVNSIDD